MNTHAVTLAQVTRVKQTPHCPLCAGPTDTPGTVCQDCILHPLPTGRGCRAEPE